MYPLGMVWDESNIVKERRTSLMINESTLMQLTISAALSSKGGRELQKHIKKINVHTVPFEPPIEGLEEETENGEP